LVLNLCYIPHFQYVSPQTLRVMKKKNFLFLLLIAIAGAAFISFTDRKPVQKKDRFSSFLDKKDVTIIITDSGLGGLSILADAVQKIERTHAFRSVRFVFFNSLFSNEGGYNSLRTKKEKLQIFNSALERMESLYRPDIIIIGCNTLSVLFDETPFARSSPTPVLGILDAGVELISSQLRHFPESIVLLFATQTTLEEGKHRDSLIRKGFLPERIQGQACPDLVPYIERGFDSSETEMLIFAYVDEALQKISGHRSSLLVSLNCTHYGYSLNLWKKAFENLEIKPLAYLNPNTSLNDFLLSPQLKDRFSDSSLSVEVVSMVEISGEKIRSISACLEPVSPSTAAALKEYTFDPDLFPWEKPIP
jgi:glutamate racemase